MARGSFDVPSGFRDSAERAIAQGEVVASTYAIRDEISRTDTGVVFEARDMMLDRLVAFKLGWRDAGMPTLLLEARRCAAVHDPCAVAIHGMGAHNGAEFVVGERVIGTLLKDLLKGQSAEVYLTRLRTLIAAVARSHESGIAVGDISGATVLVDADGRMVLGRLSLSQVPAFGPHGQILAPEVVRHEVEASDPAAAEMARGTPPFSHDDPAVELRGHAGELPPRLAELRDDLPAELSDLVDWLLAKHPGARPRSATDVLAQLDALVERLGMATRSLRVLIVDDDTARARWMWSLARRAHPAAIVEIASEGSDAAHKLNRDQPDLVFVDATLKGVMNTLELCMYARGLDADPRAQLIIVGEMAERDRNMMAEVHVIPDDDQLAFALLDRVRASAKSPPPRRRKRSTVSG
jgi:CheY-like chemotaxis protein